ncbi:hypothetical protein [Actinacidiphila epipremni]|uniref:DUF4034 domain-containing protein n=1 Tax=Actinacidiphila epipremni TaxID=2053013 RepID=A0ABX1A0N7_9ACTN|nr:hypothetical protein [Actinacidiphila epipremni]NJP47198.1 hypothetical protein [Actinacidiphila epipremni]
MSTQPSEFRPSFHPAAHDADLRKAVEEVRVGRWMPMRDLLARTGTAWALRTARSQVLAAAAARSHVVRTWLTEEPTNPDALMMRARVDVGRALHAWQSGHESASGLAKRARESAHLAMRAAPPDPVPWVCLLALAQLDLEQRRPEHHLRPPDRLLPPGPWGLLREVQRRDPFNREGHHRVLRTLLAQPLGGPAAALHFAHWVKSWVPWQSGSALLVLPLYAYAQHYRDKRERGRYDAIGRAQWTREPVTDDVQRALKGWFDLSPPLERSPLDLNYLAHALWAGHRYAEAAGVFAAIGPYMATQPWSFVASDPGDPQAGINEFLRARGQCLAFAGPPRAGPA